MQSKRSRIAAAAFIAAGVAVVVNGCTLLEVVDPPIQSAIYTTGADGKSASATVTIPSWVPDDAQMVRIKTNNDSGATILEFTVVTVPPLGGACDVAPSQNVPQLDDTWWVQQLPADDGVICWEGYYVWANGTTYFAYKN